MCKTNWTLVPLLSLLFIACPDKPKPSVKAAPGETSIASKDPSEAE